MRKFLIAKFVSLCLCSTAWALSPAPTHRLAVAIAKAEGFYTRGTIPNRTHNPGDIRAIKGYRFAGQVGVNRRGYVIFKNDAAGFAALRHQIDKIVNNESRLYTVNHTLRQIGKRYAESPIWARNVAKTLGVTPDTRLWEILDVPPTLRGMNCRS